MAKSKYNDVRRWRKPAARAKGYAEERREKKHLFGNKAGQPLNDYKNGLRSGYLQCQSDHAGMYRYNQAMKATNNRDFAQRFSQAKNTELTQELIDKYYIPKD